MAGPRPKKKQWTPRDLPAPIFAPRGPAVLTPSPRAAERGTTGSEAARATAGGVVSGLLGLATMPLDLGQYAGNPGAFSAALAGGDPMPLTGAMSEATRKTLGYENAPNKEAFEFLGSLIGPAEIAKGAQLGKKGGAMLLERFLPHAVPEQAEALAPVVRSAAAPKRRLTDLSPSELVDRMPAEYQTSRGSYNGPERRAPPGIGKSPAELVDRLPKELQTSRGTFVDPPARGVKMGEPHAGMRQMVERYHGKSKMPAPIAFAPQAHDRPLMERIAQDYTSRASTPDDGEVRAAYEAFNRETDAQYQHLLDEGYTFTPADEAVLDAYDSAESMRRDLLENKHLTVFTGGTPNPLMTPEQNYRFRAVHDAMTHGPEGYDFSPDGEFNAALKHSQSYSPEAQRALFTETVGQNSALNYGPDGEFNRANMGKERFPEQKALLLPKELTDELLRTRDRVLEGPVGGVTRPTRLQNYNPGDLVGGKEGGSFYQRIRDALDVDGLLGNERGALGDPVKSAAIRFRHKKKTYTFSGPSHFDAVQQAEDALGIENLDQYLKDDEYGFLNSANEWYSRDDAWKVAKAKKQLDPGVSDAADTQNGTRWFGGTGLASEDVSRVMDALYDNPGLLGGPEATGARMLLGGSTGGLLGGAIGANASEGDENAMLAGTGAGVLAGMIAGIRPGFANEIGRLGGPTKRAMTLEHFSPLEGLSVLDPAKAGTGTVVQGAERATGAKGIHFFDASAKGKIEAPFRGLHRYPVKGNFAMYDLATDPDGIVAATLGKGKSRAALEKALLARGYDGFTNSSYHGGEIKPTYVMLKPVKPVNPRRGALGLDEVAARGAPPIEQLDLPEGAIPPEGSLLRPVTEGPTVLKDVPQIDIPRPAPAVRPATIDRNLAPWKKAMRSKPMLNTIMRGVQDPNGPLWYVTDPVVESAQAVLGPEEGMREAMDFFGLVGATSPRTRVQQNLRNASMLRSQYARDELPGGLRGYPMMPVHTDLAEQWMENGRFNSAPKASGFTANLQGNFRPMTSDAHHQYLHALFGGVEDPSTARLAPPMYQPVEQLAQRHASQLQARGLLPNIPGKHPMASLQSRQWLGGIDQTGVQSGSRSFPGHFEEAIFRTAAATGLPPEQVLERFWKDKAPLLGLGGLATGWGQGGEETP